MILQPKSVRPTARFVSTVATTALILALHACGSGETDGTISPAAATPTIAHPPSPTDLPLCQRPAAIAWSNAPSPDGTWSARYASMGDLDPPAANADAPSSRWVYLGLIIESVDGQSVMPVVNAWSPDDWKCSTVLDFLGWSRDSLSAFAAITTPCTGGCNNPVGTTGRILRIDVAEQRVDDLLPPEGPMGRHYVAHGGVALSPDGRWIALREGDPGDPFTIRLLSTGDDTDRTATLDMHSIVLSGAAPQGGELWVEGPWSIEWHPDSTSVRFSYTTGICKPLPSTEGWLRYELVTDRLSHDERE